MQSSDAVSDVCSVREAVSETESLDSDGGVFDLCTCGGTSQAHKRDCPMSSWKRYSSCAHFPPFGECRPDGALTPPPGISSVGTESDSVSKDSLHPKLIPVHVELKRELTKEAVP